MEIDRTHLPLELRVNLPEWLLNKLTEQLGEEGMLAFSKATNLPAPLDLRVNSMKTDRASVQAELALAPIQAEPTPFAPDGLRILKKPSLQNLPLFKSGAIEVQDEGSQTAVADKLGITPAYLSDILNERTHVSDRIAAMVGLRWMLIPDDPKMEAYLSRFVKAPEGTKVRQ